MGGSASSARGAGSTKRIVDGGEGAGGGGGGGPWGVRGAKEGGGIKQPALEGLSGGE